MSGAGGFQRSAGDGPSWSYESTDRYGLRHVSEKGAMLGWMAITHDGVVVACFRDAGMATAIKDMMNMSARPKK